MSELEYSTCYENMLKLFDEKTRPFAMKAHSLDEYSAWKQRLRVKLLEITGIDTVQPFASRCEIVSRAKEDGYTRVKALLAIESNVQMPMYILIPDGIKPNERRACVIAPHGHGAAGKESVAGVGDLPEVSKQIDRYNGDYGLQLVKIGYVVFCPDARGSGERREEQEQGKDAKSVNSSSCDRLSLAYYSLGRSLTGMWVWDLMRLIDYIGSLDYCDTGKIACCGFSGGGLQTLWLAALDDRVKCAVISGYFHSYRDSVLKTNFCGCNFVPHLWECAELGDIAALIAPRPLLIESGDSDPLAGARGLVDVGEQLETVRTAYSLFGREECLIHHVFVGGHRYNGEKTGVFLKKFL